MIDVPKQHYIYTNYKGNTKKLYGKGLSYTKVVEDCPVNRGNIAERIKNKEFEFIIYPHIHFGKPLHNLVIKHYEPEKIIYMCGQDSHRCPFGSLPNFFLREQNSVR